MRLSLDRFEGDCAICEDDTQKRHDIQKNKLPRDVKPGDILRLSSEGKLIVDNAETARRKARIKALQDRLMGNKCF